MMWIAGVSPLSVLHAYVAATVALFVSGIPASLAQQKYAPIVKDPPTDLHISFRHVAVVIIVLVSVIAANVGAHLFDAHILDEIPLIGLAVAAAILLTAPIARPDWSVVPRAARGALFLIALVSAASMMPVKSLPLPSWETALGLGFVSAVFDNIPLTALAIKQGNYDWGFLAYAVGFRRLDDLVRLVRRRRCRGTDAGSEVRGPLAQRGMARGACLCRRVLPHACAAWLEP